MRRLAWPMAVVLAVAVAAPVAGGTGLTYHGVIDGATFTCGQTTVQPYETIDGTWNLNISGAVAVVTLNVFYDGVHHLAYGMPGGTVEGTPTAGSAVVRFGTLATAVVDGDSFRWEVPNLGYACPSEGHTYNGLTYVGTVGR